MLLTDRVLTNAIDHKPLVYLRRQRIQDMLEEAIHKPLTTVVAGAGYGKTQAVYTFLKERNYPAVWLQITPFDNLYTNFWGNFIKAVSKQHINLAAVLKKYVFPETLPAIDRLISAIADAGLIKFIIVIDDFYVIYDKKILKFVEKLIYANLPGFSVVLISRNEPEINIAGLMAKGFVTNITEFDLRFTQEEMREYFQMQNLHPSPQTFTEIYNATDGWIFAIHLAELSLKRGAANEKYAITAMRSNIFKLMEIEIFEVISGELQKFLVKLSLLDDLPPELVDEICSGNNGLITEMSQISSFIRFDTYLNTYLIHNLFLEFLTLKQEVLSVAEKKEIYLKAARWCVKNGYKIDAISYYEKAENYAEILHIAYTFSLAMPNDAAAYILEILTKAPKEIFTKYPHAYTVKTRAMFNLGMLDEAETELNAVIQEYEQNPPSKHKSRLLFGCYRNLAFIAMNKCLYTRNYNFDSYFEKASLYFPSSGYMVKSPMNSFALGPCLCRVSGAEKGEIEKYIEAVAKSVPYASASMNGCMYGLDDLCMAEYMFLQNNLKYAEELAYRALYKSQEKNQHEIESRAFFYLLRINVATGNYKKIQDILNQLELQLQRINYPNSYTIYEIITGWFYSLIKHTEKVPGWIKSDFEKSDLNVLVFGLEDLVKTKYYLSEKQYHELLAFIRNNEKKQVISELLLGRIVIMILKAVALYNINEKEESIEILQEAYMLSSPNKLDMPFIELGNGMRSLTREALKSKKCAIPRDWLEHINRKSSTYAKKLAYITACYREANNLWNETRFNLTVKELEVLTDLCQGLSRTEIASYRNLSVNTVKDMIQTVYLKLGTSNTKDSIRVASQMGLLD